MNIYCNFIFNKASKCFINITFMIMNINDINEELLFCIVIINIMKAFCIQNVHHSLINKT